MIAFIYLIPLLTCVILYATTGSYYGVGEYLGVVAGSMAFTGLLHWLLYRYRVKCYEYLGSYISRVRHEDAWTEIQEYYETETNSKGESRQVKKKRYIYHPEEWYYYTSIGSCFSSSQSTYDYVRNLWGTPCYDESIYGSEIKGGVRYYQEYYYSDFLEGCKSRDPFEDAETFKTMIPVTEKHKYTNKIKSSNSIFRFEKISKEEAEELGLKEYPSEDTDISPFLGKKVSVLEDASYRLLNAYYGSPYQIRFFILFFDSKKHDISTAEKQRAYWCGGNKNEFVMCLGVNDDNVDWCKAFSWMDSPVLATKVEDYFRSNPKLELMELLDWLRDNLKYWKRKEFADFDYINVSLSPTQYWIAFIATCLMNILIFSLMVS